MFFFLFLGQYQIQQCKLGFTATNGKYEVVHQTYCFENVECSIDNLIDIYKMQFVIPVDGLYTVHLTIKQMGKDSVNAFVCHIYPDKNWKTFCKTQCTVKDSTSSKTAILWLKAGDAITLTHSGDFQCIKFSCYLYGL